MSKAEKFIDDCTSKCSNIFEGYYPNGKQAYFPWVHPKQARKAVEIAREEIYKWLEEHSQEYVYWMDEEFGKDDLISDLKQAMKDE